MYPFPVQVSDEVKHIKASQSDRMRQLLELHARIDENSSLEISNVKTLEDEIQSNLNNILAADESRRAAFQLAQEEEQQNVAVSLQIAVLEGNHFLFFPLIFSSVLSNWSWMLYSHAVKQSFPFSGKMDTRVSCLD